MDFIGYLFWGGLALALSPIVRLAVNSLTARVRGPFKSARLRKILAINASTLVAAVILSAGLVAAAIWLPPAPPTPGWPEPAPDLASGEGTPPFGRWEEEPGAGGPKPGFSGQVPGLAPPAGTDPAPTWPQTPPRIGRLELSQETWEYIKEAAQRYHISPYLIQAVCAIESRYDPNARSGKCRGLMQLHRDTAKKYGVNPLNPRENILAGAAVLANLLQKYDGDLRKVLRKYNAQCTPAYEREVIRAYHQARQIEIVSLP